MKILVYDTYVPKENNTVMHFDILVAEDTSLEEVYRYGKEYLAQKGIKDYSLSTQECNFCHMEKAPENIETQVNKKGYFIIEMENC